jgi:hypothetical protein
VEVLLKKLLKDVHKWKTFQRNERNTERRNDGTKDKDTIDTRL